MQQPNLNPKPKRNQSEYYLKNREKIREQQKLYRELNKEKLRDIHKQWAEKNPEKLRENRQNRLKRIPEHVRAQKAAYKRRVRSQMPIWADKEKIFLIYKEAQNQGKTVDHIVPLKGENVCGLHVDYNLQLLDRKENSRKRNKYCEGVQH
jgi:hypothetical protein